VITSNRRTDGAKAIKKSSRNAGKRRRAEQVRKDRRARKTLSV
jgi:hypothetical protein